MSDLRTRVCSKVATHDITEAEPWATVCPICGWNLIEVPVQPSVEPKPIFPPPQPPFSLPIDNPSPVDGGADIDNNSFPPQYEDPQPQQNTGDGVGDPDPIPLPAPALVCSKNPDHDITGRQPDSIICPTPGCGGALIQLQCETSLMHDVSRRAPGQFTCPVCDGRLMTPRCSVVRTHSMVARDSGQTACPIPTCGRSIILEPWTGPISRRWWPPAWWSAYRLALLGGIAALVAVALLGVLAVRLWPQPDLTDHPCEKLPPNLNLALAKVTEQLKAGMNAADARASAQRHLSCGFPEPALLLLRRASEEGDGGAARILGRLFDPSAGPDVSGRQQMNPTRAVEWYVRAAKANDPDVHTDLERLIGWLKERPDSGDAEPEALIDTAQAALDARKP